ncbi:uncharacterized protein [Ptychodera flava]|uniref:uncharacterized protein n=1 Tax=Ptychodera flava TaxID=63121 RepID=UPI00396A3F33
MFSLGAIAAFAACTYYYSSNNIDAPPSVRKPSSFFTGKEHTECLKAISQHFNNHRKTTAAQRKVFVEVLHGLGGCGKTEIMCSYVWENWKRYKGGVYFLDGKSNSCLDYGFMQILKKMRLEVLEEEKNPTLIRWTVFNKLREKKDWLLVIDDADDPDLIQQLLINMYDLDGHIVITSRAERGWLDEVKPTMTPVPLFSNEDSAIYLLRHKMSDEGKLMSFEEATQQLKRLKSEDQSEYEALMWLGGEEGLHGLPLALKQASKYVCQHSITFNVYKRAYIENQPHVIQSWDRGDPLLCWFKGHGLKAEYAKSVQQVAGKNTTNLPDLSREQWQEISKTIPSEDFTMLQKAIKETPYVEFVQMNVLSRKNVVTTWKMNYESLAKEEHVKQFLHLCACLGTHISVALLIDGVEHLNQGPLQNHLTSIGTISSSPEAEAHRRINDLFLKMTEHSFTTIVGRSGNSTSTDNRYSKHTIHHLLQQVMFVHFLSREEKIESLNNAIRMLKNLFPKHREVTGSASATVYDRHSVITLHTLAVCQQIRTLKKDEIDGLVNISPLFRAVSNYLLRLGRAEDAKILCKVMTDLSRLRKPNNQTELAKDLAYLGRAYFNLKLFDEAEISYEESLKFMVEENRAGIHILMAKQKLARVKQNNIKYMEDDEESKKIETFLQENLVELKKLCENQEDYHYALANAYHQLGRFYQDTRNYEQSHRHLEEALEIRKRYAERYDDEENIAIGMINLARNQILKGECNNKEVEKLLIDSLEIKRKFMSTKNESYQLGLYYLAVFYRMRGDTTEMKSHQDLLVLDSYQKDFEQYQNECDMAKCCVLRNYGCIVPND